MWCVCPQYLLPNGKRFYIRISPYKIGISPTWALCREGDTAFFMLYPVDFPR